MTTSSPSTARIRPFEILRRTLAVYADQPRTVLLAGAAIGLVSTVNTIRLSTMVGLPVAAFIVESTVVTISVGALVRLTSDAHNGLPRKTTNELVRFANKTFWKLLLIAAVSGLSISILFSFASTIVFVAAVSAVFTIKASAGGLLAAFAIAIALGYAPGVLLAVLWSVAAPVAVIEKPARLKALKRSRHLVRGNRLRILALITLIATPLLAGIALTVFAGQPGSGLDKSLAIPIITLLAPLPPIASTLVYLQLTSAGAPLPNTTAA